MSAVTQIEAGAMKVPEAGCWIWGGATNNRGYGMAVIDGKYRSVHRAMYEQLNGVLPKNIFVCHRCDVKACCNPHHLYAGTHQENVVDAMQRDRYLSGAKNNQTVLTDEQATEIRRLHADGVGVCAIARMFSVSHPLVSMIVSGKRRKSRAKELS